MNDAFFYSLIADPRHWWDVAALVIFLIVTIGYLIAFMRIYRTNPESLIQGRMARYRILWMESLQPEDKVLAVQTCRNQIMASSFMASTSILLVIGLLNMLRINLSDPLSFLSSGDTDAGAEAWWIIKILLLTVFFFNSFFNFTMSVRDMNYLSYLTALKLAPVAQEKSQRILANLNYLFHHYSRSQTHGTKAYFFALPILFWLVHPILMIITTFMTLSFVWKRDHFQAVDSEYSQLLDISHHSGDQ